LGDILYRKIYPTTETPPKFYGLPKIHKDSIPLRPIVSSIDSITYNCAKHLEKLISPVIDNTISYVKNSRRFTELLQGQHIEESEELRSFDVKSLLTSVPVDKAVPIIKNKLESDPSLGERTSWSPSNIAQLLDFCQSQTNHTEIRDYFNLHNLICFALFVATLEFVQRHQVNTHNGFWNHPMNKFPVFK